MNNLYEFFDTLFLRAPYYSFEEYAPERVAQILTQQDFKNALHLASPDFYEALAKKNFNWAGLDKKEQFSLYKYYNRMSFRPTPFGAFSFFSLMGWDEKDKIKLEGKAAAILHLLPSRQWIEINDLNLQNNATDYLIRTNPTLNPIGNSFRFIRSVVLPNGKMKFQVNEISGEKLNKYIIRLCNSTQVSRKEIICRITEATSCPSAEANNYLDFLINEQVVLTEYNGSLIVPGYWEPAHAHQAGWERLTTLKFSAEPSVSQLSATLKGSANKNMFYAALERDKAYGGVGPGLQADLLKVIGILRRLVIPYPTPALRNFKDAFKSRFEEQRIPLLLALDPDTGISYGGLYAPTENHDLLSGLAFPNPDTRTPQLDWTAVHRLFLRIWIRNSMRSSYEPLILSDQDLSELDSEAIAAKLPPSLAVMFTRTAGKILLDNVGGATAISLIGRFSAFSPEVSALCREIAGAESAANPDVVFAEVHQLSDTHVDNINRRTPVYDHVITVNTFPGKSGQQEIALNDLVVSVKGEELWLESLTLGKRVIPRLPTAYNFHHNDLAIFQMLCDLQFEGLQANLTFDLEKLFPGLDFYPRVEYGNTVISLARWKITANETAALLVKPLSIGRLHQFRQIRGIPGMVTMGLSDQQLVFNLVNDDEALFFLECLTEHKAVTLKEYIPGDRRVMDKGKALNAQFIALLRNPRQVYGGLSGKPIKAAFLLRDFPPGSNWLYVKIYCTALAADLILEGVLAPFLKSHATEIALWFFIRYQDPEPHLRIRIKSKTGDSGLLITALSEKLLQRQYCALVREIKYETYQREIERYSETLMERVEAYFCAGSEWVIGRLKKHKSPDIENSDLAAFVLVFHLAAEFLNGNEQLLVFFKWRSESFLEEFGGEKTLKVSLDNRYRQLYGKLKAQLGLPVPVVLKTNKVSRDLYTTLSEITRGAVNWSPARRNILLSDLIHMQVNRMFANGQRQHEALIFYCLYKYTLSAAARKIGN